MYRLFSWLEKDEMLIDDEMVIEISFRAAFQIQTG